MIVVTSQQRLKGRTVVVTYSVADLAYPIPKRPKRVVIKITPNGGAVSDTSKPDDKLRSATPFRTHGIVLGDNPLSEDPKAESVRLQELIDLLTSTRELWRQRHGRLICEPGP